MELKARNGGQRNGPPYPLDYSQHSPKEKNLNSKSSISNEQKNHSASKKGLTRGQKKAIIIGAAAAATALAVVGGVALYKSGKLDNLMKIGQSTVAASLGEGSSFISDNLPFKQRSSEHNYRLDYKGINPNRNLKIKDVNFMLKAEDGIPLHEVNCAACSLAYELKCRGYDVVAQLKDTRKLSRELFNKKAYINPDLQSVTVSKFKDLDSVLSKFGEGARGNLGLSQTNPLTGLTKHHSVVFEIINGKVAIFDTQKELAFGASALSKIPDISKTISYVRTDNLRLNDLDFIKSMVVDRI